MLHCVDLSLDPLQRADINDCEYYTSLTYQSREVRKVRKQ